MDDHPEHRRRRHGRPVLSSAEERTPIPEATERIEAVRRLCADQTTPWWRIDEASAESMPPALVATARGG